MVRFGILSPPGFGHLNGMIAIGRELMTLNHSVTVFSAADSRTSVTKAGLNFMAIGEYEYPEGSVKEVSDNMGKLVGIAATIYNVDLSEKVAKVSLRDTPTAIQNENIDVLLVDQSMVEGKTIAEITNIPFITICNALILDPEPNIPPLVTSWNYDISWWSIARNQLGYSLFGLLSFKIAQVIENYRRQNNLPIASDLNFNNLVNSNLAVISQQIAEFEYPRTQLPPQFHFTGLFSANTEYREPIEFPWNRLNGKPIIYASMGTIQNQQLWIFEAIANACKDFDCQLIISIGGSKEPQRIKTLPGSPLVVKYAPQLEILEKASLCITHAGMNTTLECLKYGIPMVAIPIANDQPGIASRIEWTKTGMVVQIHELLYGLAYFRLKQAIEKVIYDSSYRENALKMQQHMRSAGGVKKAVDIIERAVATNSPIYRA